MKENKNTLISLERYLTQDVNYLSTRHASETFNAPPSLLAREAMQQLTDTLNIFFGNFPNIRVNDYLSLANNPLTLYNSLLQEGRGKTSRKVEGAPTDYFQVDTSRNDLEIVASLHQRYEPNSIPIQFLEIIEQYRLGLQLSYSEATRFAVNFLQRAFGPLSFFFNERYIHSLNTEEASRSAFGMLTAFLPEHVKRVQQELKTRKSLDSVIASDIRKNLLSKGKKKSADCLELTEADAKGLIEAYHLQDKPYTSDQLNLASFLATKNQFLLPTFLSFHLMYLDFTLQYLALHPERMQFTLEPFSEIFLTLPEKNLPFLVPNPKLLKSVANNWLPAIAAELMEDQGTAKLSAKHIKNGILRAKNLDIFQTTIGQFNQGARGGEVIWQGMLPRTCPAMNMFTRSGVEILPVIYNFYESAAKQEKE